MEREGGSFVVRTPIMPTATIFAAITVMAGFVIDPSYKAKRACLQSFSIFLQWLISVPIARMFHLDLPL